MGGKADVVRSAWEGFRSGDMDQVAAAFDDSAEIVIPESLPWGGTYRGPDGFRQMIGEFTGLLEDFRPSPENFLEDGDHVVVPLDIQARTKTGKDMSGRALWLYRVQGSKIVRAEIFADTASTLEAVR
jgi:ketosteroid isomerase-like protein